MNLDTLNKRAREGTLHGIIPGISNEDYHRGPGLSSSGLVMIGTKSPAHYRASRLNPKEATPALIKGNAIHIAILEPELMDSHVTFIPDSCKGGSKAAREEKVEFLELNAGKYILPSGEDFDDVKRIVDSVHRHPVARALLSGGAAEQSCYWTDPETGVLLKCRSDYLRVSDGLSVNLKSTTDASFEEFQRSVAYFKYHWQSGLYIEGFENVLMRKFIEVHLVVEKEEPYAVAAYLLDDATLEKAREEYRPVIARYAQCLRTNTWPGYQEEVVPMNLPAWAW